MYGYVPVADPESPHIKEIAEWAVAEYNKQGHQLMLSSVVKYESQIVSGVNYRFILATKDENDNEGNYEAVVWEKIWENFKELISFQLLLTSSLRDDYVSEDPKDPVQVINNYVPVADPESPHIKEIAKWAVAEYNKQGHQLTLSSVVKCESQIVSGVNYRFILATKDENDNEGNYEAVVWEKIWENFKELISFQLLLTSSLRDDYVSEDPKDPVQVINNYVPVADPESPHIKEIAEWAVAEYNKQGHQLTLSSVVKYESQIVSGVNYRFILATKDENDNEGNYEAVVWEKIWENFKELISFRLLLTQ